MFLEYNYIKMRYYLITILFLVSIVSNAQFKVIRNAVTGNIIKNTATGKILRSNSNPLTLWSSYVKGWWTPDGGEGVAYKSNGSSRVVWYDKSGNGNNMYMYSLPNAPTNTASVLDGYTGCTFNGANSQYYNLTNSFTSTSTDCYIWIYKRTGGTYNAYQFGGALQSGNTIYSIVNIKEANITAIRPYVTAGYAQFAYNASAAYQLETAVIHGISNPDLYENTTAKAITSNTMSGSTNAVFSLFGCTYTTGASTITYGGFTVVEVVLLQGHTPTTDELTQFWYNYVDTKFPSLW